MKTYRLTTSNWRWCPWCSAKWGSEHPRATFRSPKTVEDVLNPPMIVYPFRLQSPLAKASRRRDQPN